MIDKNSWQIACIVISHDADSPFYRNWVINEINNVLVENKTDNHEVKGGEVIIFQDKIYRDSSGLRSGMNIVIKIALKTDEKELKKELSLGFNPTDLACY